jgi:hypothetical protein
MREWSEPPSEAEDLHALNDRQVRGFPSLAHRGWSLSDLESPSDLERSWNVDGQALGAVASPEHGAELLDRDPRRADKLAQRPRRHSRWSGIESDATEPGFVRIMWLPSDGGTPTRAARRLGAHPAR